MSFSEDIELARAYGIKAAEFMERHNVPPHPRNYELWFLYAGGLNRGLVQIVDERIASGEEFDDTFNDDIYEKYVGGSQESQAAITAGRRLDTELGSVLKLVESATGDTNRFGESMRGVSASLDQDTPTRDVRAVVETIVDATRQMEERSRELEERLLQSKNEVSELRNNLETARSEAMTDQLTGIPNRKAFDDALMRLTLEAMEHGGELCLIISDIDHFKKFNDTYGHRTGDHVLRLVAKSLSTGVADTDVATRYGGEEFAVVMPNTTLAQATKIGNRIREAVKSRPLVKKSTGESLGRVTLSMGVAAFKAGEPLDQLIERADACLYAAKNKGRNLVVNENDPELGLASRSA